MLHNSTYIPWVSVAQVGRQRLIYRLAGWHIALAVAACWAIAFYVGYKQPSWLHPEYRVIWLQGICRRLWFLWRILPHGGCWTRRRKPKASFSCVVLWCLQGDFITGLGRRAIWYFERLTEDFATLLLSFSLIREGVRHWYCRLRIYAWRDGWQHVGEGRFCRYLPRPWWRLGYWGALFEPWGTSWRSYRCLLYILFRNRSYSVCFLRYLLGSKRLFRSIWGN